MKDRFAAEYPDLERWHWWFRARRRVLTALLRRRLAPGRDSRIVVSLGSGHPAGLGWLRPFAGPDGWVVGLDADPAGVLIDGAASPAGEGGDAVFAIGRIGQMPLRSGTADLALMLDVIEHIQDDARALSAGWNLLRPGGLLLVTVPAFMSLWGAQDIVSEHVRRYDRRSLRDAFDRAGVPAPEIGFFNFFLFPPIAAVRWGRRWLRSVPPERSDFAGARPGASNALLERVFGAERHLIGRVPMPVGVSLYAAVSKPR